MNIKLNVKQIVSCFYFTDGLLFTILMGITTNLIIWMKRKYNVLRSYRLLSLVYSKCSTIVFVQQNLSMYR